MYALPFYVVLVHTCMLVNFFSLKFMKPTVSHLLYLNVWNLSKCECISKIYSTFYVYIHVYIYAHPPFMWFLGTYVYVELLFTLNIVSLFWHFHWLVFHIIRNSFAFYILPLSPHSKYISQCSMSTQNVYAIYDRTEFKIWRVSMETFQKNHGCWYGLWMRHDTAYILLGFTI
jgi:hypothetical protein